MKFREQYKKLVIDCFKSAKHGTMYFWEASKKHSIDKFYIEEDVKKGCRFKTMSLKITAKCYLEKTEFEKPSFKFQEIQFHKTQFINNRLLPNRTWFCLMGKGGGNP